MPKVAAEAVRPLLYIYIYIYIRLKIACVSCQDDEANVPNVPAEAVRPLAKNNKYAGAF